MNRTSFLVGGFVLSALVSCGPKGGTDVGNGATVKVNLRAYEEAPMTTGKSLKLASGVEIDAVWIGVRDLKLNGDCNGASDSEPSDFLGPVVANLLDAGVIGEVPEFDVPNGDYCRLRMRLHQLDAAELPAGAPAELAGNAVLVTGRRADGVPFSIATNQTVIFHLDATSSSFSVEGVEPFIVGFELTTLVGSVNLDSYTGSSIVIDDVTDPPAIAQFDKALRISADLFRDDDDDGALSPSESAPGRAVAADLGN